MLFGLLLLFSSEFLDSGLKSCNLNLHVACCGRVCISITSDKALLDTISFMKDTFLTDVMVSVFIDTSNLATTTSKSMSAQSAAVDNGHSYIRGRHECPGA